MSTTNALGQMAHSPNHKMPPPGQSTTFNFTGLPIELQFMIWDIVACFPRIIEVKEDSSRRRSYGIAAKSRIPPAILHVSSSSRARASEKLYKKRFGQRYARRKAYIWFNDAADVLLFRGTLSGSTMTQVFRDEGRFQNLGYMIKDDDARYDDVGLAPDIIGALPFGLVHGKKKNFFVVLRSDVWDLPNGAVDFNTTFRVAKLDGRNFKARDLKQEFAKAIKSTRYSRAELPTLHFVNFAPLRTAQNPRVFDTIAMSWCTYDVLVKGISDPTLQAEFLKLTDCSMYTQQIAQQSSRAEIGLFAVDEEAMRKGVKEVKTMMVEALRSETKRLTAFKASGTT